MWADNQKIFEGQTIFKALTSFFELAFVFQVEYSKEAQLVVTILQNKVARYGDNSGTLTHMRKDTVNNKLLRYYSILKNNSDKSIDAALPMKIEVIEEIPFEEAGEEKDETCMFVQ